MNEPRVIHADLEKYATERLQAELDAHASPAAGGVLVSTRERDGWARQVIVRDDSGPRTSLLTAERSLGVSVLAGTLEDPQDANELARVVMSILTDLADLAPGNPIAAVLSANGPYPVTEPAPFARRYMTVRYSVVGSAA